MKTTITASARSNSPLQALVNHFADICATLPVSERIGHHFEFDGETIHDLYQALTATPVPISENTLLDRIEHTAYAEAKFGVTVNYHVALFAADDVTPLTAPYFYEVSVVHPQSNTIFCPEGDASTWNQILRRCMEIFLESIGDKYYDNTPAYLAACAVAILDLAFWVNYRQVDLTILKN